MVDPRQVRTRAALSAALLDLVAEESLASVSVAALSERAGVHRTTFYKHAASVEEFAVGVITGELDEISTVVTSDDGVTSGSGQGSRRIARNGDSHTTGTGGDGNSAFGNGVVADGGAPVLERYRIAMIEVLEHVAVERSLYRPLLSSKYGAALRSAIEERMRHRVRLALEAFAAEGTEVPPQREEIIAFVSGALVGVIVHWAYSDDLDAEAQAARVQAMMPPWWPVR